MANINFKVDVTGKTLTQLRNGTKRDGSKIWINRIFAKGPEIGDAIGDMLVSKFNNSTVAKALRGQGSEDLPAHFGLNDSTANALVDGMGDLIRSSIRFASENVGGILSIRIQAVDDDWNKYLVLPGASHIAQPSNIEVPVVKWLLIDPNIDIGQAAYDIVFLGEDNKFDVRIQKVSKSGRAIMVSLDALGGGGGYVLPSIISGQAGGNFIENALGQKGVALAVANIIMKKVK